MATLACVPGASADTLSAPLTGSSSLAALTGAVGPDPLQTSLQCKPANGVTTRAGDDISCRLVVLFTAGWGYGVTADITVPSLTSFDPSLEANQYAQPNDPVAPTSVHYDTLALGTFGPGIPKAVTVQLHLRSTDNVGDTVTPVATVHTTGAPDFVTPANTTTVEPQPPDLTPSTMSCADAGPAPLKPGDDVLCTVQLADAQGREAATDVRMQTTLPTGLSWLAGGDEDAHVGATLFWQPTAFPDGVPPLPSLPGKHTFYAHVPDTIAGKTGIVFTALVTYSGAFSGTAGQQALTAPALTVAPSPAVLTDSGLSCADADGGRLLPGDGIDCTLTVADAASHEDVKQIAASAPVPASTTATSPAATNGVVTLDGTSLGTIAAGTSKTLTYHLKVAGNAVPGTTITPTAHVEGHSTPTDVLVAADVTAQTLTVAPPPATLTSSSLSCADTNGGTLLVGDAIDCTLTVTDAPAHEDVRRIAASAALPAGTVAVTPAALGSTIALDGASLGTIASGTSRTLTYRLQVGFGAQPGTVITPTAHVEGHSTPTDVLVTHDVTAAPLTVGRPPAVLTSSTLGCTDVDGGTLLPGDAIACTLTVADAAGREDVGQLTAGATEPGATTATAPAATGGAIALDGASLGTIAAGTSKTITYRLKVNADAVPGTKIAPTARIDGVSTPSGVAVGQDVGAPPLFVGAPAAVLTSSALSCADADGGTLLTGDAIDCTLTIANAAGHEDVGQLSATAKQPAGTTATDPVAVSGSVGLDAGSLGTIAGGTSKSIVYHLKVNAGTAAGTVITPTAHVDGRSTPSGKAVSQDVTAPPLTVGRPAAVLTSSTLTCADANGGTLLAGDGLDCTVRIADAAAHEDVGQLAVAAQRPAGAVAIDPVAAGDTITLDGASLGTIAAGTSKALTYHLQVAADTAPGTTITPTAHVDGVSTPSGTAVAHDLSATAMTVGAPPAVLTDSGLDCVDGNGGRLLAGDPVDCTLTVADAAGHEAVGQINAAGRRPPATRAIDPATTSDTIALDGASLGTIAPGTSKSIVYHLKVDDAAAPGTTISPTARITGTSTPSGVFVARDLAARPLVVDAPPAVLTGSTLACGDANGGTLLPGDGIDCTLTIADAAAHEDVDHIEATAAVPAGAVAAGPAAQDGAIALDGAALGTIAAGSNKTIAYHLKVAADTAPGTRIAPTAHVKGRSAQSGTAVEHSPAAAPLTVAAPPAKPVTPAPTPPAVTAASPPPAPARNPHICYSRRKIIINVAPPHGQRWKSVTLSFGKKKVKAKRTKSRFGTFRATVTFYGLPKGPMTVSIVGKTRKGKTIRRARHYRLCTPRGR